MKLPTVFVLVVLSALVACGKSDKAGSSSGGGGGDGPACAQAAAYYLELHVKGGGNRIASLKPTADELKTLTAAFEADCKSRPWSGDEKTCVMAMKDLLTDKSCFQGPNVSQMVYDAAQAIKAAREAGGAGSAK